MAPAIENDARDIARGVETGACEHIGKLPADAALVFAEGGCDHFAAATMSLVFRGEARVGVENFNGEDDWRIGADGFRNIADGGKTTEFEIVTDALWADTEPATAGDAEFG